MATKHEEATGVAAAAAPPRPHIPVASMPASASSSTEYPHSATTSPPLSSHPSYMNNTVQLQQQSTPRPKSLVDAYIAAIPLGLLGAHHFYLRRWGFGVVYLTTFGLMGVGWLLDLCRMPYLVSDANRHAEEKRQGRYLPRKSTFDAYTLWFPLGVLGLHHFYLRRYAWGVAYLCTLGFLGVGWIIDVVRIPGLVREYNASLERAYRINNDSGIAPAPLLRRSLGDAYVLAAFPITGVLGIHHYYLDRVLYGMAYTFTFGLFGVGYIVDIFRLPLLVERTNNKLITLDNRKYLDDAYVMWFPMGLLGFHHFYLRRYCWGVLYVCTFGCFGVGWIVDFFRLPHLVSEFNTHHGKPDQVNIGIVNPVVTDDVEAVISIAANAKAAEVESSQTLSTIAYTHHQQAYQQQTYQQQLPYQPYPHITNYNGGYGSVQQPASPYLYPPPPAPPGQDANMEQPPSYLDVMSEHGE